MKNLFGKEVIPMRWLGSLLFGDSAENSAASDSDDTVVWGT